MSTAPMPWPSGEPVVVGVLLPRAWFADNEMLSGLVAGIESIDSRVRVVVEGYIEPHELRMARGKPDAESMRYAAPPLIDAQRAAFAQIDVALALDLPFDVRDLAPRLRWVQAFGAGTAQLQSAGLREAGIRLTSSSGASAIGIAEFAFARLLQELKCLRMLDEAQDRHQWEPTFGGELQGRTLGLIGLGSINSAVAARAKAFAMRVLATRRSATTGATAPNVDVLFAPDELHTMLAESDAVIAAVPETAETMSLMDAKAFAAMPDGSFFCNVGRGSLVDEAALIDALRSGHLRAAALDVASAEPLPPDDPLWEAPNLYLSPHCSASLDKMFDNLQRLFIDNLRRFLAGEPLHNEVDLDRGY